MTWVLCTAKRSVVPPGVGTRKTVAPLAPAGGAERSALRTCPESTRMARKCLGWTRAFAPLGWNPFIDRKAGSGADATADGSPTWSRPTTRNPAATAETVFRGLIDPLLPRRHQWPTVLAL